MHCTFLGFDGTASAGAGDIDSAHGADESADKLAADAASFVALLASMVSPLYKMVGTSQKTFAC